MTTGSNPMIPPRRFRKVSGRPTCSEQRVLIPAELLSILALERLEKIRARTDSILPVNRKRLGDFLEAHPDLPVVNPAIGTTVFPKLPDGAVDEFLDRLRTRWETSAVPGHFFEIPQHFRIGIRGETGMTAEGLARLRAALKDWNAKE
jgi:hypothetical protein